MLKFGENILWPQFYIFSLFTFLIAYISESNKDNEIILIKRRYSINVIALRFYFFILFLMAAFRGFEITNDTLAYYNTFTNIRDRGFSGELRMENGYVLLNVLLSKILPDDVGFYVLLFIASAFSYYVFERWIEKNTNTYGVCIIVFYFLMNPSFVCVTRQTIAVSIVLLALPLAQKHYYIRYTSLIVLAALFHKSAIICLVFIFIINRRFNKISFFIIISISLVLVLGSSFISTIISILGIETSYETNETGGNVVSIILSLFYIVFFLLNYEKKRTTEETESRNDFYLYCNVISVALYIMVYRMPILTRMNMYFYLPAVPYFSKVFYEIENRRLATILRLCIVFVVFSYSYFALTLRPEWGHLWPYKTYWNSMY